MNVTFLLLLHNVAPLAHVQTVQELTDILVPHTADLLDVGGALRDVLEVVTGQLDLVLLVLGGDDLNTRPHGYAADELLAQEVPTTFINIRHLQRNLRAKVILRKVCLT